MFLVSASLRNASCLFNVHIRQWKAIRRSVAPLRTTLAKFCQSCWLQWKSQKMDQIWRYLLNSAGMSSDSTRASVTAPHQCSTHDRPRTLKEIDDNVTEVRNVINSKRKRDRIRAFFASKWYTRRLKKCKDDLDWAIELFRASGVPNRVT